MKANGNQLSMITSLLNESIIRPVVDRVFQFERTNDALEYVEAGRAKGKVVIRVR
jgi:alcohol dehydrogenase